MTTWKSLIRVALEIIVKIGLVESRVTFEWLKVALRLILQNDTFTGTPKKILNYKMKKKKEKKSHSNQP